MNGYRVEYARSARKELESLPAPIVEAVLEATRALAAEPRPPGARKLRGSDATHRLRIGDYRVIYEVDDRTKLVLITRVRHRKDAYRG
jgi:mRNA interferase RelE/StbE